MAYHWSQGQASKVALFAPSAPGVEEPSFARPPFSRAKALSTLVLQGISKPNEKGEVWLKAVTDELTVRGLQKSLGGVGV